MRNKNTFHILRTTLIAGAILFPLSACQTVKTTQAGAVGVDRQQRMSVSAQSIEQNANKQYGQLMADANKKDKLNADTAQYERVKKIADKLIKQTPSFRPDALNWKWEVNVLTSGEVNAWCMPGGKIAVYSGLIEKLKITDDELAAVMGHEIAHALREHSRERASEQTVANVGITILATVAGLGQLGQKGMEYAYQGLLGLPNSREHETEADRIGVELAARAGYDPRAAITLWEKMGQVGGNEPPKFMSTHPPRADRVKDLTRYSQKVLPLFEQAKARG
ncbi:MAG: M48 family metallopeptidase [Sulfuritalea sp.]|nr:M48 family metallopeptidase [Polynucleobacter sp.]MCF8188690.1 M48 family metallopeptidase [Sulfuritalea sp.]